MTSRLLRESAITAASLALLLVGFLLDLETERELVIAIVYNVPIALSALARSRRLTLTLLGLAFAATLGAGAENMLAEGAGGVALVNRGLAALSFALVGVLVLALERTSARMGSLKHEEARAHRETELRHLVTELSRANNSHELLSGASKALHALFSASRVVIARVQEGRLTPPHYSHPSAGRDLCEGRLMPWVVASLPVTEPFVATARVEGKLMTVGRLRRPTEADLVILVVRPSVSEAAALLAEALEGLEPLLEHSTRLEGAPVPLTAAGGERA